MNDLKIFAVSKGRLNEKLKTVGLPSEVVNCRNALTECKSDFRTSVI
jgi:hypothetical protein